MFVKVVDCVFVIVLLWMLRLCEWEDLRMCEGSLGWGEHGLLEVVC